MLYIGKLVNTHGIKGEVKIISDFKYKEIIFKKGSKIYINDNEYIINSYRKHKNFDMITLNGINDINEVLTLKGKSIYINKEDFIFPGILNEDLYGKKVYDKDQYIGNLEVIEKNGSQELLVIKNNDKTYLVPYVDEFVKEIDESIHLDLIKGFINEDWHINNFPRNVWSFFKYFNH